nr:dirigent protein 22-like [Ipomoea batatas]GME07498.1 dirigent protein 22-like [Ipomoea batatas]
MAKVDIFVLLCLTFTATSAAARGVAFDPKAVDQWFESLPYAKERVTKLHFYFHDIAKGKNLTALQIAQSNITSKSSTLFGSLSMADEPLTVGPELNSTIVGHAQGMYGSASFSEIGLLMAFNFVFTGGKYNGSTLSLLGRNPTAKEYREMPIVGGSGVFRLARGVATAKTYLFNVTSGIAIVEYHVTVLHY